MKRIEIRPILCVGLLPTLRFDVGDILKVTLEDNNVYHGRIQEIDMENCTIAMYKTPEEEEIMAFYAHQIVKVDDSF